MPELPEVETVARSLQPLLPGKRLLELESVWPRAVAGLPAASKYWQGAAILSVDRRAKYLILRLSSGALIVHLRMTGRLFLREAPPQDRRFLSAQFRLDSGEYLIFEDTRRFGRIDFAADEAALSRRFAALGPEPLDRNFSGALFFERLQRSQRQIKALLLDQGFIAGLGNIYVDESLWYAGIHPLTRGADISRQQTMRLLRGIRSILRRSIAANGATLRDFRFLGGQKGGYTARMLVFRRQGQPCRRCGASIQKIRVAGRGTHICPRCQRGPRSTTSSMSRAGRHSKRH
ncbi:MAG: bifunctional DNA-formamidopyrimidine glycosylase/DNA-(apurinic or apyrimidinic site) lyase [Leptospirales bacterium]|nr:bifunctional DNA-formamidopyrimidine glycosylase/DNA-(apurinic or apyrimidinic site) lyase [Leptospirales bacterium]